MTQYIQPSPVSPVENVQRGTIFTLAIIPAGIIVWDLIWSFGFIVSIVAFGIAAGAAWLYRKGSGGIVSRQGAVRVVIITVLTLALAIFGGLVTDGVVGFSKATGMGWIETLTTPLFWTAFWRVLGDGQVFGSMALPLLLSVLFAFLGSFRVLRSAMRETGQGTQAAAAAAGYQPSPYTPGTQTWAPPTGPGQVAPTEPAVPGQVAPPTEPTKASDLPVSPTPPAPGQTILNGEPLPPARD